MRVVIISTVMFFLMLGLASAQWTGMDPQPIYVKWEESYVGAVSVTNSYNVGSVSNNTLISIGGPDDVTATLKLSWSLSGNGDDDDTEEASATINGWPTGEYENIVNEDETSNYENSYREIEISGLDLSIPITIHAGIRFNYDNPYFNSVTCTILDAEGWIPNFNSGDTN